MSGLPDRAVVVCLIAALYGMGALLSQTRPFDQDEFLHAHAAWSMAQGLMPYRDYFDQYTPLFRVFLLPFFHVFNVGADGESAIGFLFVVRMAMWAISGAVLYLTWRLGRVVRSVEVGFIAMLFLIGTEVYWNKALEIRPDTLAVAFWLLSLLATVRAIDSNPEGSSSARLFAWSGALLAVAFLTMQKVVFAFPGLAVGLLWCVLGQGAGSLKRRAGLVACYVTGFCAPLVAAALYFAAHGALREFIQDNFLNYLKVPGFRPYHNIQQLLYQHPFLGLCGVAGLLRGFAPLFRTEGRRAPGTLVVAFATSALIAGLFVIPVPQYQYFVLFLPLMAVFAAAFLVDALTALAVLRDVVSPARWLSAAAMWGVATCGAITLIGIGTQSDRPLWLIVGYWAVVLVTTGMLVFVRYRRLALIAFLCGMTVNPMIRLQRSLTAPDTTAYLAEIRYVMQHTSAADTVMDGYEGSGVFRPHSWFYWFLAYNDRQRLTDAQKEYLLEALSTGTIAPKLILFDRNLRDLSPSLTAYFERHYEPAGTGVIWRRREILSNVGNGQWPPPREATLQK